MSDKKFLAAMGSRIRKIRTKKELSLSELAYLCDFEKASLSRIESGQVNTTVLTLCKISKALEVPISDLLKD